MLFPTELTNLKNICEKKDLSEVKLKAFTKCFNFKKQ